MSTYPIIYPTQSQEGPSRPTTVITFSDASNPMNSYLLPGVLRNAARQVLTATDLNNEGSTVILIDWKSQAQKNELEHLYKNLDNVTIDTFDLPENMEKIPQAGWYICNYMKVPLRNQAALAAGYVLCL